MNDVYTRHKPIRNKIKTYEPQSIIDLAIRNLHSLDKKDSPNQWGGYMPWNILLLIRWTYQYSDPSNRLKNIKENEFNDLLNKINDLGAEITLEGQKTEENKVDPFLRRQLFFQLPYQISSFGLRSSYGRQLLLFDDMGQQYELSSNFQSITGLKLNDFLDLSFLCWDARCNRDHQKVSLSYFNGRFSDETINAFFRTLALNLEEAKNYIRRYTHSEASIDYQRNEHTPLERKPFFMAEEQFIPYSGMLLASSFMNNVYDIFKEDNKNFSRDYFGEIFENYISKGLQYAVGDDFRREKEIQQLLPRGTKAPDFFVQENEAAILFDAKSTELHPIPRVLQSRESLIRNLESTILHGVLQIYTTAHHLVKGGYVDKNHNFFGIIVTYKDYLLGDGERFWNNYIGEYIQQKLQKNDLSNCIQAERLFFISVDDFDRLIAGAKERKEPISPTLETIVERNKKPETRCLMLKQHLQELWEQHYCPDYVKNRFDQSISGLVAKIDPNQ